MDDLKIHNYGDIDSDILLVQMVDDHDLKLLDKEIACIKELSRNQDFCLRAIEVNNWNKDLSPWEAPAVFGKEDFGEGAERTLQYLLENVIPYPSEGKKIFLGGYSLSGLFALWAGYQTDVFDGIAAASPSIWFPHFITYMHENTFQAEAAYLSLGNREEKTKNPVMSRVGEAVREAHLILHEAGTSCILEWNKGNHFKDPDLRTAKAFAWLMDRSH